MVGSLDFELKSFEDLWSFARHHQDYTFRLEDSERKLRIATMKLGRGTTV